MKHILVAICTLIYVCIPGISNSQNVYIFENNNSFHVKNCAEVSGENRSVDLQKAIQLKYSACEYYKNNIIKSKSSALVTEGLANDFFELSNHNFNPEFPFMGKYLPPHIKCSHIDKDRIFCEEMTINRNGKCLSHQLKPQTLKND